MPGAFTFYNIINTSAITIRTIIYCFELHCIFLRNIKVSILDLRFTELPSERGRSNGEHNNIQYNNIRSIAA